MKEFPLILLLCVADPCMHITIDVYTMGCLSFSASYESIFGGRRT